MNDKLPGFLKRDGDALLFGLNDGSEFIFYVPEIYFDRGDAVIVGEYVNLLGVLDYAIFNKSGNHNGLKTFNFPTVFLSKPSTIEKIKGIKLTENSNIGDYRLLRFKYGDQIVVSTKVPEDINNVEEFYRLFLSGKLPTTIKYDKAHEYPIEAMSLNGSGYGINLQLFGILISEMYRSKKDISVPFRLSKSNDMTNYQTIAMKDIGKYIDTFAAITSENWDKAVVGAITNQKHQNSPMERLLTESALEDIK